MSTSLQPEPKAAPDLAPTPKPSFTPVQGGLLQRKCACGGSQGVAGYCGECGKKWLALHRYSTDRAKPSSLPRSLAEVSNPGSRTAAEAGHGHDFSRVQVHTRATHRIQTKLAVSEPGDQLTQRMPDDAAAIPAHSASAEEAQRPGAAPAEAAPETAALEETAAAGMIMEDEAREIGPGQMRKSEFLDELRAAICAAADAELASVGRSTEGCPYIEQWIEFYRARSSRHVERSLHRYTPEAAGALMAREYIPLVSERVRRAVTTWARTGEITEVPEELANQLPGANIAGILGIGGTGGTGGTGASAIGGAISGVVSGLTGGVGKLFSGIGNLFAKAREGGVRPPDNSLAIQSHLRSGAPLDGGVKARMESAFGHDFSRVRVHTDARAAELSRSLNARAFTIGSDIAFGTEEYQPGTLIGDALVAHELAHVVQQGGAISSSAPLQMGGMEYNALEEDADRSAVGAVASLWGGVRGAFGDIIQNAIPRLRSGLRLQRCPKSQPQVRQPDQPDLRASDRACLTVSSMVAKKTGVSVMSTTVPGFACALSFGEPPNASGMTVESVIDVPSGCEGTLEYVQLVDTCRQLRIGSKDFRRKSSGYILDKQDPWRSVEITSPGNSTFFAKDSPAQPVVDKLTFVAADDKFKTWLLWRPSGETTRIPLAKTEWSWKAKATKAGSSGRCADDWTISDPDAKEGTGAETTEMPTWTDTTENLNKSAEPGTCD